MKTEIRGNRDVEAEVAKRLLESAAGAGRAYRYENRHGPLGRTTTRIYGARNIRKTRRG